MRKQLYLLAALVVLSAQSGEDYGQSRLPPETYRSMPIPSENSDRTPEPQTNDPQCRDAETGAGSEQCCSGVGCPPREVEVAQQLLRDGPDTREIYPAFESIAHQFAVVGFVREGWPLSIEYAAEPGTATILRIKLYHRRKILIFPIPFFEVAYQANLDAQEAESEFENPWHRTVTLQNITLSRSADPAADGGLHVARYEVRSYRVVDGRIDKKQRAPVRVLGITVGPEVVGSLSLFGAGFADGVATIPARGQAPLDLRFRYTTDRPYDLLKESIEVYNGSDLNYRFDRQLGAPHSAAVSQRFDRVWQVGRQQRPGKYRASISGWWNCRGVTIADSLAACPDNPNWAVATSDEVVLSK